MLRVLPEDTRAIILENMASDLRGPIDEMARSNESIEVPAACSRSRFAPWPADTSEKALEKYVAIDAGLRTSG